MAVTGVGGSGLAAHSGKIPAIAACGFLGCAALATIVELIGGPETSAAIWLPLIAGMMLVLMSLAGRTLDPAHYVGAARTVPPVISGLSVLAVAIPMVTFLSTTALLYDHGFDGLSVVIGAMAGVALGGVLLGPYLARSGAQTLAEFVGLRFGAPARVLAALVIVFCSGLVAVAGIAAFADLASGFFQLPVAMCILVGVAAVLVAALPGGGLSAAWTGAIAGILMLIAVLVPAFFLYAKGRGISLPQTSYGEMLASATLLERQMIEKGLANAQTIVPHVKPFLEFGSFNFFALSLSLMAGAAAWPLLLSRSLSVPSAADARTSSAWSLLFILLVIATVPALAALAKVEVYKLVLAPTPLTMLPDWLREMSADGSLRLHGLSLALFEAVGAAHRSGATDAAAVASQLGQSAPEYVQSWQALKAPVQALVLEAASGLPAAGDAGAWEIFRDKLLPAVAPLSGNKQGMITLAAIDVDADALIVQLPRLVGLPAVVSGVLVTGGLAAALAVATAAVVSAAAALSHDLFHGVLDRNAPPGRRVAVMGLATAVTACAAGWAAQCPNAGYAAFIPVAFSLAGVALCPVLLLGIWWRGASAWGAVLGMAAGIAVVGYYLLAPRYAPVSFDEAWGHLSNSSPAAVRQFKALAAAWSAAAEGEPREVAWSALTAHAAGASPWKAGAANWLGVPPAAAALFGLPAAFLMLVLGSLATRRPTAAQVAFVGRIRRPDGAPASDAGGVNGVLSSGA